MVNQLSADNFFKYYIALGDPSVADLVTMLASRVEQYARCTNTGAPDFCSPVSDYYTSVNVNVTCPGTFTATPTYIFGNSDDYFYNSGKFGFAASLCRTSY